MTRIALLGAVVLCALTHKSTDLLEGKELKKPLILSMVVTALLSVIVASAALADVSRFTQVESFSESSADISTTYDAGASPDDGISDNTMRFLSPPSQQFASKTVTLTGSTNTIQMEYRARSVNTDGTDPNARIYLDGTASGNSIENQSVDAGYTNYTEAVNISPGSHTFNVRIANDQSGDKLFIDWIRFTNSDGSSDSSVTLAGAGDVGDCAIDEDRQTGNLVQDVLGSDSGAKAFVAGDIAYEDADTDTIQRCYDEDNGSDNEAWGDFINKTYFVAGNHEYSGSTNAQDFFNYFDGGVSLAPSNFSNTNSYYSANLSDQWVLLVLNSNASLGGPSCSTSGSQYAFAQGVLQQADADGKSVVAMWHHPRFSEHSSRGDDGSACPDNFFDLMVAEDGDLVVNGHNHFYERYTKRTASGSAATGDNGVTQLTVGTGGRENDAFGGSGTSHDYGRIDNGILKLDLNSNGTYHSEFRSINSSTYDSRTENVNP